MTDAVLLRALIVTSRLAIAGTGITRAARHPLSYARHLAARVLLRVPSRDPDGDPLDRDEMRAFVGLVEIFRHPATPTERSRT